MPRRIAECVPNFSEGRDARAIGAIAAAMGAAVLDLHSDADHNRSVVTLAGAPAAVLEAAFHGVEKAVELIDLNRHSGAHPRIGAADVVPFVPVEGLTLEDCASLAVELGERIWSELRVPVYLYEAAARRPETRRLEMVRRGGFEGLREAAVSDPSRAPDIGAPRLHPTAGATAVGARNFLIAYNINLATPDVELARRIARSIRASSGGFPYVKAMGLLLASRNQAQVSMNLTDFERTPVEEVFEAVRARARVASCELVGMIPRRAFELAPDFYRRADNFHPDLVIESRLAALQSE